MCAKKGNTYMVESAFLPGDRWESIELSLSVAIFLAEYNA